MIGQLTAVARYRPLLLSIVGRQLKSRYRGSAFGFLWSFLNPLFLMLVYWLVFSTFLRFDIEKYPVYVFTGLLPWVWFSSSLSEGANSILYGSSLITKVYFPVEILPLANVLANLVNFLLSLPILFAFLIGFHVPITRVAALLPVVILIHLTFIVGFVFLFASLNVFYRDVQHIVGHLVTIWFFLCPIIYPASIVPEQFRWVMNVNPMGVMIEIYHQILLEGRLPAAGDWAKVVGSAVAVLAVGYQVFNRYRRVFAEEM